MSALRLDVVSHAGTTRRIEHTQQTQLTCARIFNTVHLSFGQIDARAGLDYCVGFAGPHPALASEDEKYFFILMKMIRRATGRDRADKLRSDGTTQFLV